MTNNFENNPETKDQLPENEAEATISEKETSDNETNNSATLKEPEKSEETQWKAKFEEMNEKYLRLYSEFDNYRKRSIRERLEESKIAGVNIIESLLPVIDDLERSVNAFKEEEKDQPVLKGILLIYNKFKNILKQKGLEEMETSEQVFNPDLHEAISQIPEENPENKNKIVDVLEKGYFLNGKVIRFAKVIIAS